MSRSLGILQVAAFPFPGPHGGPVYAARVCEALAGRGHRVVIVTGPDGEGVVSLTYDVVRPARLPGAPRIVASGPHWTRVPNAIGIVRAIRRQLAIRAIDVVHAHHVEAALLARIAIGDHPVPLVLDWHASLADELPRWLSRGPDHLVTAVGGLLDRAAVRASDAVLAISRHGEASANALGARSVTCVPPGIDLAELTGADPARARGAFGIRPGSVVYAGNTDPYQDVDVLFTAMVAVPVADLVVLTADPVEPLHALADRVGLPVDRRRFVHTRAFADVRDGIAASAVAVVPRARCAGFPIKLLNSLGLGVPTVVSVGSWSDVAGAVPVPDRDPGAMAAAIVALLADPARRTALGEAAMADVSGRWSLGARAAELEAFYARVVAP